MKNEKVENKKIHKDTNQDRVAGMQVRSGVKAGRGSVDRDPRQRMTRPGEGFDRF